MREEPYETEDVLQRLVEDYPTPIAGDADEAEPRRWVLLRREVAVPSDSSGSVRWSADHFFVDQDAVPTIVEVKRSSDTRM